MANRTEVVLPSDTEIHVIRSVDAPRDMVWEAHTRPDLLRRWMLGPPGWAMPVCDVDLRVGGKYRYVWRNDQGHEMGMGGTFTEVKPVEKFAGTQLFDGGIMGAESLVATLFAKKGGRTTITVAITYQSKELRDAAAATPMAEGMEQGYQRLERLIAELS